jgi:hypothetical protein
MEDIVITDAATCGTDRCVPVRDRGPTSKRLSMAYRRGTVLSATGGDACLANRRRSMAHGWISVGFERRMLHRALASGRPAGIELAPRNRRCASPCAARHRPARDVKFRNLMLKREWTPIYRQAFVMTGERPESPRHLASVRNARS